MVKQPTDVAEEIVRRIMSCTVPEKGQLIHPLKSTDTKKAPRQVKITDASTYGFPSNVDEWKLKNFVDYFAKQYQEATGANYRKSYRADNMIFQLMGDFLVSNGLERNKWLKNFIDWSFKRRTDILRSEGHFTPQEVLRYANYFYQDQVLPKVEQNEIIRDTQDTNMLDEIDKSVSEGKLTEVFCRYGIPAGITYLINVRKMDTDKVIAMVDGKMASLVNGSVLEKELLSKMLQSSIIGSPYPSGYEGVYWRDMFGEYTKTFRKEIWWRENDYKGKPLPKYYSLLEDRK